MIIKLFKYLMKHKTILYAVGIITLIFSLLINVLFTVQLKYENTTLKEEIFELENRIVNVSQELEKSKTDIYIHREASERLGLVKSNETPIKIVVKEKEDKKEDESEIRKEKLEIFVKEWYREIKKIAKENGPL